MLLSSFPKSWDGLVMVLSNYLGLDTLKFENVVNIILSEETQRKSSSDSSMNGSALNMDGRERSFMQGSEGVSSKSIGKGGVQFFYCKVFGHIRGIVWNVLTRIREIVPMVVLPRLQRKRKRSNRNRVR